MTDTDLFPAFFNSVKSLWPSYRCTDEMLRAVSRWDKWLSDLRLDYIRSALHGHRVDFPDGTRPEWGDIFRRISGKTNEGRMNDFQILLRNVRDAAKNLGNKGVETWSDEDTWFHYTAANPCNRADRMAYTWRSYLTEIGEPVPGYLEE